MTRALKRFLVSSSLAPRSGQAFNASTVILPREETHHLKHVLRIKEGDMCLVFDSEGHEFISRIERFLEDERSEVQLLEPVDSKEESAPRLTVAQAIPQDRKMDDIIEKASELGVYQVIPLVTERTVVRMSEEKEAKAIQRWQKISDQTIKQSRLKQSAQVAPITSFEKLCQMFSRYNRVYLFDTSDQADPISEALQKGSLNQNDLMVIGPEGGFSTLELNAAEARGAKRIGLGSGILKTDTAFIGAVSYYRFIHL